MNTHSNHATLDLSGTSEHIVNQLLTLLPTTPSNPGADFYFQLQKQALTAVVPALQISTQEVTLQNLADIFHDPSKLLELANGLSEGQEKTALDAFVAMYSSSPNVIDITRLKQAISGLSGRILASLPVES